MPLRISGFTGEQPRILPRLMAENAAQTALNVRLDDGGLTPMRQSAQITTLASAAFQTLYRWLGTFLGWSTIVHAVPGAVAQDRLYFTGDGVPKLKVDGIDYPLALSRPAGALTATLGGAASGDVVTRIYAYTWVTGFAEESEPSPVSASVDWRPGNSVTLSGFAAPPTGRNITKQRIYRSQTGSQGTAFYLIAERAASADPFSDTVAPNAFQEALPSATYNPPVDTLQGLIKLPNGMMAAFSGRDVYFCEPYKHHAWPQQYSLAVESDIVGLGAMGNAVLVMTKAQPYLITGTAPENMVMEKTEHNLPCINGRGIVDLGYAIAYPSTEGVVVATADGAAKIASTNIWSPIDYKKLGPATWKAAQYLGRYVAAYSYLDEDGNTQAGLFMLDLSGQAFLIRSDTKANALFTDLTTGELFYTNSTTQLWQFDAPGAALIDLTWRSKQFVLPFPDSFARILVEVDLDTAGGVLTIDPNEAAAATAYNASLIAAGSIGGDLAGSVVGAVPLGGDLRKRVPVASGVANAGGLSGLYVKILADGELIYVTSRVNDVDTLPDVLARVWEIEVFGHQPVEMITLGRSAEDMRQ